VTEAKRSPRPKRPLPLPFSNPAARLQFFFIRSCPATNFLNKCEASLKARSTSAQYTRAFTSPKVRFPKVIKYRRIEATIYCKKPKYDFYGVACCVAGKRHLRHFKTYQEAKNEAERKVREIADGSQAAALNADQSRDALAALPRLETLRQSTGASVFVARRCVRVCQG
jgi:hypothetical protein